VSHRPLAQGRIFPREVIARGSSRHRSNTDSCGGLREPDLIWLAPQAFGEPETPCAKHQAPGSAASRRAPADS
jgi:hypothetical protein